MVTGKLFVGQNFGPRRSGRSTRLMKKMLNCMIENPDMKVVYFFPRGHNMSYLDDLTMICSRFLGEAIRDGRAKLMPISWQNEFENMEYLLAGLDLRNCSFFMDHHFTDRTTIRLFERFAYYLNRNGVKNIEFVY